MFTLYPMTSGIRDGRHQHYPSTGLGAYKPADTGEADESACKLLMAYHHISYLRLVDGTGAEVREYRRCDFFQTKSPLRDVHHRVVEQRLEVIRQESAEATELADAGK